MIQERITQKFDVLSPAQKRAAHYMQKHMDKLVFMTAKDIARNSKTSEPTIHRLAKTLGYEKYIDMAEDIKAFVYEKRSLNRLNDFIAHEEEGISWYEKHFIYEVASLRKTMSENNSDDFVKAAKMLLRARHIYIAGWRVGLAITRPLAYMLRYMLGNATLLKQGELSEANAYMSKEDLLICSGFPRYCKDTITIAKMAKNKEIPLLVFTDSYLSPFHKMADLTFIADTGTDGFLDSYVSPLAIVNLLIKQLAYQDKERIKQNITAIEENFSLINRDYNWKKESL